MIVFFIESERLRTIIWLIKSVQKYTLGIRSNLKKWTNFQQTQKKLLV